MRELVAALRAGEVPAPARGPAFASFRAASRALAGPGGGPVRVTPRFEPRLTRHWDDPSVIGVDGYVARGRVRRGCAQALAMAAGGHRRGREGERAPRSRRRRVPHRDEVGVRAARHRQADLRRRELRRVRARDVQQPRARRARSAPAARGDGDRGARDRVRDRVHLHPRRVPVAERSCWSARSPRRTRRGYLGPDVLGSGTRDRRRCCTAAPAPTSAARRRRC